MEVTVPRWPLQCEGRNFYGQKLDNLEHAGDAGSGPRRYRAGGARGSALGVQSREGSHDFADSLPVIRLGTARLPRRFAPRNDTSGGCQGAPEPLYG